MSDTKHITGNQDTMGGGGDLGTEPAAGGDLEFDPSTVDAAPGKKPTGILIMLLVLGLAVGMLFSMKTLTKVSGSAGKNTKVEGLVEDFLKAMGSDRSSGPDGGDDPIGSYNDVVNVLTDNYTKNQVKDLGRNPFEPIDGGGPVVVAPAGNAFERAANKLVLKSVMGNSIANFNGRIVRVGQVFPFDLGKNEGSVEFKLTAVGPDSATVAGVGGDPDAPFEQTIFLRRNN